MKFFSLVEAFILAIPFYYLWNYFAPIYLPNIPDIYKGLPFWNCVGVFVLISIVKTLIMPSYNSVWARSKKW
jgi:hypothetical protein